MALKLKHSVSLIGIKPEITVAIHIANSVFNDHGYDCILTSVSDGNHAPSSLHYCGFAFDLRIRHIKRKKKVEKIFNDLNKALNDQFDIVLESTHIHVEYQPNFHITNI